MDRPTLRGLLSPSTALAVTALLSVATANSCGPSASVAPDTPSTKDTSEPQAAPPTAIEGLPLPPGAMKAAEAIDPTLLKRDVMAISDDAFAGRGPGTAGDAAARKWLAEQLGNLGYRPGMPGGGWEQPFDVVGITAAMPDTWTFRAQGGKRHAFSWWDEFIAASGVQRERVDVKDAEVVFVGHGIVAPEEDWDDFGDADLTGKILLVLNDEPSDGGDLFAGERRLYYGRWTYKYESAARRGAAGAIIIHTDETAGYPWGVVQTSWDGEQVELPAGDEPRSPVQAWLTESAAKELVALAGADLDELRAKAQRRDFEPIPLGITTSLSFDCKLRRTQTANVVGVKPGADPELQGQAVVFTAHHDHLGTGKPNAQGDAIYNGARDNGTGVAMALGVARSFARLPEPPRRSVVFLFVGAEEQGLLGSKFYAEHPTVPAERIAANINFELGNIWGPTDDVVIHGKGKTSLDGWVEAAAGHASRRVEDEADPRSGWYYRSDQLSFARVGVPAIWFESGRDFEGKPPGWGQEHVTGWIAQHYHQPTDEVTPEWRFDGMAEDTALAFLVGAATAHADAMPTWTPGDEFERFRKKK